MSSKNMIDRLTLIKIFFRNFFVQSAWNFEKMQNLGFAYCIIPALKKIYGNESGELQSAVKRHLQFFNTHPYLTAPILGATIRLEENYKATGSGVETINSFKNSLMGICGGVGDTFFWGAVRPTSALLGVLLAVIFHTEAKYGEVWYNNLNYLAPVGCFVLYNAVHISFRATTFFLGYSEGISIMKILKKIDLTKQTERIRKYQPILLGVLLAFINNKYLLNKNLLNKNKVFYNSNTLFYNSIEIVLLIAVIFLFYFTIKKKISPILLIYITSTIVLLSIIFSKGVLWN